MSCPTCSGTVQCVSCRMEGRPAPRPRTYPGRRPLGGTLTHTIRRAPEPEPHRRDRF